MLCAPERTARAIVASLKPMDLKLQEGKFHNIALMLLAGNNSGISINRVN